MTRVLIDHCHRRLQKYKAEIEENRRQCVHILGDSIASDLGKTVSALAHHRQAKKREVLERKLTKLKPPGTESSNLVHSLSSKQLTEQQLRVLQHETFFNTADADPVDFIAALEAMLVRSETSDDMKHSVRQRVISLLMTHRPTRCISQNLRGRRIKSDEIMVSFDVTSLFISIPPKVAREVLSKRLEEAYDETQNALKIEHLMGLFEFCQQTFFTFAGETYEQIKGTPMGSPVSGLVAELVLQELEKIAFLQHEPVFWRRYVDDTFVIFHKTASAYASSYRQKYHDSFPLILGENLVFTVLDSQDARCVPSGTSEVFIFFRHDNVSVELTNFNNSIKWKAKDLVTAIKLQIEARVFSGRPSYLFYGKFISTETPPNPDLSTTRPALLLFCENRYDVSAHKDLHFYAFKALQIAYAVCDSGTTPPSNDTSLGIGISPLSSTQRHFFYLSTLAKRQRRCRLATVCPIWWNRTLFLPPGLPWRACGLNNSELPSFDSDGFVPVSQMIARSLADHPDRRGFTNLAFFLSTHLSTTTSAEWLRAHAASPPEYTGVDEFLTLGSLHQSCCEFAVTEAMSSPVSNVSHVRDKALSLIVDHRFRVAKTGCPVAPLPDFSSHQSPADALACKHNRTLAFYPVSSVAQPAWVETLVGELPAQKPLVVILDPREESVFKMDEEFSYDNVASFIEKFHNGSLRAHLASRPPKQRPHAQSSQRMGRVSIANNASHFEELIYRDADVLVLYYGRHCGYTTHSRGAITEFRAVADYFASRPSSPEFVMIDVDSVQLPWSLRVEYVPNVILFPRNRKSYSAVLPAAAISSADLYNNLIAFVLERLKSAPPDDRAKYGSFVGIPSGYQNRNSSRITYTADTYLATVRQHCILHNSSRACMDYFASGPLENHARQIESSRSLLRLLMRRLETGLTEVSHALASPDDGLVLLDRLTAAGRARVHRLQDVQHALSRLWRHLSGAEALFTHESKLTASLRQRLLAV
ncbi:intramolecular oxidoreductase activity, transposing S-S bonds [Sparganum proliferum]